MIRTVEGKTGKCAARFDTVAGTDRIPVLRMRFRFDGTEYDATYSWQSDPDNYPRLTGYLYLSGTKSPGLEALFPNDPDDVVGKVIRMNGTTWEMAR